MLFDLIPARDITENAAAVTAISGATFWGVRKLRKLHKRMSDIWLFLLGDEKTESIVDRMIKEEFRSRYMMMHARDGIFECDSHGFCTYVNPTLTRLFGLEATQMLGNGWLAAILPKERA